MNSLAICILVTCAVLLCQRSAVEAITGQFGVCGTANGYACVTTAAGTAGSVVCSDYKMTGAVTACAGGLICYPGEGTPCDTNLGPNVCVGIGTANVSINGRCRSYFNCVGGANVPIILACPEGQEFSKAESRCVAKVLSGCSDPVPTAPTGLCVPLTTQADPTSCRHYYKCTVLGARARLQCPFNMFYDPNIRFCSFITDCGARPR